MERRRLSAWWPWLVGGGIVAGLVALAVRPAVLEVDVVTVRRGPLQVALDEEGRTRVRDTFVLTTPVSGTLSRLTLEPGDTVVAGQEVATMRPVAPAMLDARSRAELVAQVEAARAALGMARAQTARAGAAARQATADEARARRLATGGAVSAVDVEQAALRAQTAQDEAQAATFGERVAEHRLDAARAALTVAGGTGGTGGTSSSTVMALRAPVDGVVLRRTRVSEGVVPAGDVVLEVGDVGTLEVVADYLSRDAVRLRPDMRVLIDQWGGDGQLEGRVRRVEPAGFTKVSALGVDEQRVNVIIEPADEDARWRALGDGFRVEVRTVVWEAADVLLVPLGSLFRRGEDAWAVFVVEEGRAVERVVRLGQRTARDVEVLEGLTAGERVVVHPGDRVSAGVRIAP